MVMVSIKRISSSPYRVEFSTADLSEVAVRAREMPNDYINERGNGVTEKFLDYARPLLGPVPDYVRLKQIFAKV